VLHKILERISGLSLCVFKHTNVNTETVMHAGGSPNRLNSSNNHDDSSNNKNGDDDDSYS
jgi:hypothetical protein